MDLVLIRHGESEMNAAHTCFERDEPVECLQELRTRPDSLFRLTNAGILQAKIAGDWIRQNFMREKPFDVHLVSGFNRGLETAGYLLPDARWEINMYIHERDWGDMVGIPKAERLEQFADVFDQRKKDPLFPRIPNGESLAGECARIELVLDYLAREYPGKRVLIVTHGELMWCFRVVIEKIAPWHFGDMYRDTSHWIPNCGILHYSRRDPMTGVMGMHLAWMRTVHPTESFAMRPWTRIHRELWTADELIRAAERTPRLLA